MLKVDSPQQPDAQSPMMDIPPDAAMPPMGGDNMNQQAVDPMGNPNMPMMGNDGDVGGNEFDTNFDAGVDANEETDPKRFIQQLTGKLSQSLRKYNSELPQPDSDLCKFVCGMINAQAVQGLSPEDKQEVIKKIENGDTSDGDGEMTGGDEMSPQEDNQNMGDGMDATPQPPQDNNMPTESVNRKKIIDEVFQDLTNPEINTSNIQKKGNQEYNSFKRKPYISPNFES